MVASFKRGAGSEEFNAGEKLNVHKKRQHDKARDSKNKKIKCNLCGNEFNTQMLLRRHMRDHTGERPFKCDVSTCGKAFKLATQLKLHNKYTHNDTRPYKCEFPSCQYSSKTLWTLKEHKKVHSAERPFSCSHPQCKESFKCSYELKLHFCNRHAEKNIHCDHPGCEGNFSSTKRLNVHKRKVHAQKNHVCPNPECDYRTSISDRLTRHMVVHDVTHGKLSCSKEDCEFKGKNEITLRAHMRRHKTRLPCPVSGCGQYVPTKEALRDHVKLHNYSFGRAFQCPMCFKYYQTVVHLRRHCFVHTNEKPLQCGHCKYESGLRTLMKIHIAKAHSAVVFPYIVHLLDDRECLHCKVTLPKAEFLDHCQGRVNPAVDK